MGKEKKTKKKEKDAEDAPAEEAGSGDEGGPKRAQRATSNVFAMFNQSQIQEFKEAFAMMDQNRDGIICDQDLVAIYQQIGRDPDPKTLKEMLKESPGQLNFTHFLTLFGEKLHGRDPDPKSIEKMLNEVPTGKLNFTMFLTLFGEKMAGTDSETALRTSFEMFDPEKKGTLSEEYFKDLLMNTGDQFGKDEVKKTWKEAPIEGGQLDYNKFVTYIKRGKDDE